MVETTVPAKSEHADTQLATREDTRYITPPVDIYETEDGLMVIADLPGVARDDVNVQVVEGVLTIEAKPVYASSRSLTSEEFVLGTFYRQFELPEKIDTEKITADLKNGVLTLKLPKAESLQPRQIPVKVS